MRNLLITIAVVLILVGGLIVFGNNESATITPSETFMNGGNGSESMTDESILRQLQNSADAQTAVLTAVDDSASSGTAYRLWNNGMLLHAVEATMPDPADGHVYEGWLVQPEPLDFFSAGVMREGADGTWVLEFLAGEEYPDHLRVVITKEATVDATPETHILEGNLQ